jgi:hypothetical protein
MVDTKFSPPMNGFKLTKKSFIEPSEEIALGVLWKHKKERAYPRHPRRLWIYF